MSRAASNNPTDIGHSDVAHEDPESASGDHMSTQCSDVIFDDEERDDSVIRSYAPTSSTGRTRTGLQRNPVRSSGITVLKRVGRKVRQMASVLVVGPEGAQKYEKPYIQRVAPSVDDQSSVMSGSNSEEDVDDGAGIQYVRGFGKSRQVTKQNSAVSNHVPKDGCKGSAVVESEMMMRDASGFVAGLDDIYTDVYGLGFAAYVLHYTIDCASIQPTGFLLIGLTLLSARDVALLSSSERDDSAVSTTTLFTRALTVVSLMLLVVAQIFMVMGIVRVPTYYTDARDGGVTMISAPQSILEHLLAQVFPLLAPLFLFIASRKRHLSRRPIASISHVFRRAMPITVCIALWFITCFGAMSDKIRNAVGALSVNATVAELSESDVTIDMHLSLFILSPFVKTPALMSVISCCLSRNTMDITSTLAVVFYAKQLHSVRDTPMLQMISVALMCSIAAWLSCITRYCKPLIRAVASFFERHKGAVVIDDHEESFQ
jgi:hypothetical protein